MIETQRARADRSKSFRVLHAVLSAVLVFPLPLSAQHGHPLVGTWSGYRAGDADDRTRVLLSLDFSVEQVISGFIIESAARIPIAQATLDPDTWTVTLLAHRRDATGKTVNYRVEGVIENLGSGTERAIAGTWTEAGVSGDFRVVIN